MLAVGPRVIRYKQVLSNMRLIFALAVGPRANISRMYLFVKGKRDNKGRTGLSFESYHHRPGARFGPSTTGCGRFGPIISNYPWLDYSTTRHSKFDTFYMVFKKAFENKILLDRLRDFVVVPSSAGGNSSFELHSQSMEERATLDRYHHFHGHLGMCA